MRENWGFDLKSSVYVIRHQAPSQHQGRQRSNSSAIKSDRTWVVVSLKDGNGSYTPWRDMMRMPQTLRLWKYASCMKASRVTVLSQEKLVLCPRNLLPTLRSAATLHSGHASSAATHCYPALCSKWNSLLDRRSLRICRRPSTHPNAGTARRVIGISPRRPAIASIPHPMSMPTLLAKTAARHSAPAARGQTSPRKVRQTRVVHLRPGPGTSGVRIVARCLGAEQILKAVLQPRPAARGRA